MIDTKRSPKLPRVKAGVLGMLRSLRGGAGNGVLAVLSLFALSAIAGPATALALPEGRVYEMVSPVYKGGYGAGKIEAVAADGESVAFFSPGAFAGAPAGAHGIDYIARRGASGWSTTPLMVPDDVMANVSDTDVSPSLESMMVQGKPGSNLESAFQEGAEVEFQFHATRLPDTSANWELGGLALKTLTEAPFEVGYGGASVDFCHLVFSNEQGKASESEALLPEAVGVNQPLYDLARGCGGEPASLHLVASNNSGSALSPSCRPILGNQEGTPSSYNTISADGQEIFFTTCVNGEGSSSQLFVRLGATRTLEVSRPLEPVCGEVPCAGAAARASANFAGASEDGSRVFFTTDAPLSADDTDSEDDLYMAQIGCPEGEPECAASERIVTAMTQVSHDPVAGEAANVQGVVAVAPDGSRVYFVAQGVLGEAQNAQGVSAVKGADNLYVYDGATHSVAFVAELCSGQGNSGTIADARCPSGSQSDEGLWLGTENEEQTAGMDGGFLVFSTYAQLVSSDTDTAKDVYRYDAATGVLDRVSGGEAGYDANGNNDRFDATITDGNRGGAEHEVRLQYEMNSRAISEDGSRIVFKTAEPLSPDATNGLTNVYEWHEQADSEGSVSLISGGSSEEPVADVVISPSGNDVFFATVQGLVAQDTDGVPDIYDARLDGGFPSVPAKARACTGDACQGPLTNPTPLLLPGSLSQAAEESPTVSSVAGKSKPKSKHKLKVKKHKSRHMKMHGKVRGSSVRSKR
ncbi:MAG TPA: hypothetical protein VGL57_10545 [Solirubrobacteraceae bacterium]|jgi:hypothetical protein